MRYNFTLVVFLLFCATGFTQERNNGDSGRHLIEPQWNKVLNRAFMSILGAKTDNSNIGNYASLDPAAGSFTFKGSLPVGKDSSPHLSYLSIAVGGDLISDSYAALFTNSKVNTNATVEAQWHVRLGQNRFIIDQAQVGQYAVNKSLQQTRLFAAIAKINSTKQSTEIARDLYDRQLKNDSQQLVELSPKIDIVKKKVDDLFSNGEENLPERKKWTDSLVHLYAESDKLRSDSTTLKFSRDSVSILLDNWTKYRYALGEAAMAEYTAKTEKLDTIFTLKEVRFNWFTIVASIGKKNYYTFYDSLPFSNQLTKHDLTTWKLGLLWNYFSQNSISNHATYLNIGIARMEDNNTNLLSTKDVNEETAIKNSGGDTVRKISKTYKAYTDNVSDTSQWMVSANFYFLFGKRTSGFHIFPSLYMPDGLTGYFNGGVGYIVSFINNKKDQPVINAEGYIQFNDVFNSLKVSTNFLKRNEIGIRFVFPIALLSK